MHLLAFPVSILFTSRFILNAKGFHVLYGLIGDILAKIYLSKLSVQLMNLQVVLEIDYCAWRFLALHLHLNFLHNLKFFP